MGNKKFNQHARQFTHRGKLDLVDDTVQLSFYLQIKFCMKYSLNFKQTIKGFKKIQKKKKTLKCTKNQKNTLNNEKFSRLT